MFGKINKYVVLKADFNCKCLSVYFTKYLFYQSLLYLCYGGKVGQMSSGFLRVGNCPT